MQADSLSRFFAVTVTDNGAAWTPPDGALWTVRFGAPQMPAGWYDTIAETGGGTHAAVLADGNTITVEIAEQALSAAGNNVLTVIAYAADGYQLAAWPFTLNVQAVPGLEAPAVTEYYNLLTAQVAQTLANAQAAASSATLSESWAVGGTGTRSGEDTNNAEYWAQQAQQVSQGALGWYETEQALQAAHPTGSNGQWAIVGSTDTIWTWDGDTSAWVNSGDQTDLSNYYTISQANAKFAVGTGGVANSAATATKLASPVNIGGASFDGSESITLAQMGAMAALDYTTNEQALGIKWIDGNPLYRRVFQITPDSASYTYATSVQSADISYAWIGAESVYQVNAQSFAPTVIYYPQQGDSTSSCVFVITNQQYVSIAFRNGSSATGNYTIVLYYTKTTD